jgi:hypothetical protein
MATATPPATPTPVTTNWGPILHPLLNPKPVGGVMGPGNIAPDFKTLENMQTIYHETLSSGGLPSSNLKEVSRTLFTPVEQVYTAFVAAKNELLTETYRLDTKYILSDLQRQGLQETIQKTSTLLSNLAIINMAAILLMVTGCGLSSYFSGGDDSHKNYRYVGNTLILFGTLCFTITTYSMIR